MEIETNQAAETQAVSNITERDGVDKSPPVQDKPADSEKEPSQSEKLLADEIETNQATEIQAVSSTKSTEGDDKSEAVSQITKKDASSKWQKNRQPQSKTKASELVALRRKCKDLRRQLPSKRPSFGPKRQRQPTIDVNQDVAQRLARMNLPLISKQDSAYLIHESSPRFIQATRSSSSSHSTSSAAAEVVFSVFSTFD